MGFKDPIDGELQVQTSEVQWGVRNLGFHNSQFGQNPRLCCSLMILYYMSPNFSISPPFIWAEGGCCLFDLQAVTDYSLEHLHIISRFSCWNLDSMFNWDVIFFGDDLESAVRA